MQIIVTCGQVVALNNDEFMAYFKAKYALDRLSKACA